MGLRPEIETAFTPPARRDANRAIIAGRSASPDQRCRRSVDYPRGWRNTLDTHPASPAAAALPNRTAAKRLRGTAAWARFAGPPPEPRRCLFAVEAWHGHGDCALRTRFGLCRRPRRSALLPMCLKCRAKRLRKRLPELRRS